ncbi:MAG: diadenylate cyclase CdaA [Paludibacteraceae bacterium]
MTYQVGFKDIIDIFLVAILMYQAFKLLKRSGGVNIFIGMLAFLIIWILVRYVFKMELLGSILNRLVSVGAFGIIVLFQDEIKRFFSRLGSRKNWGRLNIFRTFIRSVEEQNEKTDYDVVQVVLACSSLSKSATGGLMIIERAVELEPYVQSGEKIDAQIRSRLIENIFFKNSPLHDGAMVIANRRIKAAGCILPVSKNQTIPRRLGLRHRSALGITEQTDAIGIVISEETGHISWAINGKITLNVKPEQLEHFLSEELAHSPFK